MKLRDLESALTPLHDFASPNVALEQYRTSAHLASRMLFTAHNSYDDIEDKSVLDLGTGCGCLAIAAKLCDAEYVLGLEIDPSALEVARENLERADLEPEDIDFTLCDISTLTPDRLTRNFDTVITNPPFGTKVNGIDIVFLDVAFQAASAAVYSLHKTSTRAYILKYAATKGFKGEVLAEMRYDLPKSMKFHKKKSIDVEVDFWRFEKIEASE